ncbi:MAG: TonB family protein [Gallionella sp.]|jgi:protein TonB
MLLATTVLPVIPMRERVGVVALVLLLHAAFGLVWLMQPERAEVVVNEMSVSIAMQQAPVIQPEPQQPALQPRVERSEQPVLKPAVREVAETAPQVVAPAIPSAITAPAAATPVFAETAPATAPVIDSEPDYQAGYLNNPRPAYPAAARRMGWAGRVILNVEVLSEGACGAINVFRSSGREVLDNAAMHTVKGWRFIPARHAGRSVTQWFKVPINFSLEDNEA